MTHEFQFEKVIDGVVVRYDKCDHCGKVPTDADIKAQIDLVRAKFNGPCVVCGKIPKLTEAALYHYKTNDVDRWCGDVLASERLEEIVHGNFKDRFHVHPECIKKALPFAKFI